MTTRLSTPSPSGRSDSDRVTAPTPRVHAGGGPAAPPPAAPPRLAGHPHYGGKWGHLFSPRATALSVRSGLRCPVDGGWGGRCVVRKYMCSKAALRLGLSPHAALATTVSVPGPRDPR